MTAPALILPIPAFPDLSWWMGFYRQPEPVNLYVGSLTGNKPALNRYEIATANGPFLLSIPIKGGRKSKTRLDETLIDYTHDWQRQHWGALFSAYGKAPFFEHYGPELESLLFHGFEKLLDFNLAGINWLLKSFKEKRAYKLLIEKPDANVWSMDKSPQIAATPYPQVFEERFGFLSNLSAIDLLMAEGPYAASYLLNSK